MSSNFASASEGIAASQLQAASIIPCQSFASHYQETFQDKHGASFLARPDFKHSDLPVFFEYKTSLLNTKTSQQSAEKKLRTQYEFRFKQHSSHLTAAQVSTALWSAGFRSDCLAAAWNHSLHKHLIIQKVLGTENYVVLFPDSIIDAPANRQDFEKYDKAGLFYLPLTKAAAFVSSQ